MGWCSATIIFDNVVGAILDEEVRKNPKEMIKNLIKELEAGDWDCQQESVYWNDPLIQECFRETSPELFEDEDI